MPKVNPSELDLHILEELATELEIEYDTIDTVICQPSNPDYLIHIPVARWRDCTKIAHPRIEDGHLIAPPLKISLAHPRLIEIVRDEIGSIFAYRPPKPDGHHRRPT